MLTKIADVNLNNSCQPELVEGGFRRTKAGLEEHPLQHVIAMHNEKLSLS